MHRIHTGESPGRESGSNVVRQPMKLILVSGRYSDPAPHHAADAAFAQQLARADCAVRWIVPNGEASTRPPANGVQITAVPSAVPGFGAIQERLLDGATETALTAEIRREMPDLVHVLEYGGSSSVNATWSADRMGVKALVSLRADSTLCHRGALVHGDGGACGNWEDPRRCAVCCLVPGPGGFGPLGSCFGRFLGWIRFPVNPYPTALDFLNRTELLIGGLQCASRVTVQTEEERTRIAALGIRPGLLEVVSNPSLEDWTDLYRRIIADDRNGAVGAS